LKFSEIVRGYFINLRLDFTYLAIIIQAGRNPLPLWLLDHSCIGMSHLRCYIQGIDTDGIDTDGIDTYVQHGMNFIGVERTRRAVARMLFPWNDLSRFYAAERGSSPCTAPGL